MRYTLPFVALSGLAAAAADSSQALSGSTRPTVVPSPKSPRLPVPQPPARSRVCMVETHGDGVTDDADHILAALHSCNDGGHVVFREDATFVVGTALDLTFLQHIDIGEIT